VAVRNFDGVDDVLDCATGALATSTFGTQAILVKRNGTGNWHTFLAMHNSGGSAVNQFAYDSSNNAVWWIDGVTVSGPAAVATSAWGLVVVRKATGTSTPRFSVYDFGTSTWTHANASGTRPNWAAPGASGTVRFRWETFDLLNARVAVRAAWNTVKWNANPGGDSALESAGLHTSLQAWHDATPDAGWVFNQASTGTAVTDWTGGGADQTSITGTNVITDDDPPGFNFSLGGGGATATPTAVVSTVALPQATPSVADTAAPDAIAATAALPQATPTVSATATPAVIAATVSLLVATVTGAATAGPASIAASVALPQATAATAGNATASPATIAAVVNVPQVSPSGGATVAPAVIAGVATLPLASPLVGGNVTASPATIAVLGAFAQATPMGTATASPSTIAALVAAPAAAPAVHGTAAPATIVVSGAVPQADRLGGATASPAVLVAVITLPLAHPSTIELRDVDVVARLRADHIAASVALTDLAARVRSDHITGGVDVSRGLRTGSVEYVTAEVTFVGLTAADIASVTGQVKITSDDTVPSTWDAADVTERTAVGSDALLALKQLHTAGAAGVYRVWAKVTDNPEVPVLLCGTFTVR
jgi:hypothetical protein